MLHKSGKSHLATVVGEEGETECGAGDEGDSHLPQHRKALAGVGFYLSHRNRRELRANPEEAARDFGDLHGGDERIADEDDAPPRTGLDFFRFLFF